MHLNRTDEYHRSLLETLGWELTVCNSLADEQSPCRRVLTNSVSFGEALFCFLETRLPLHKICKVIEVGGGYGNLMADFVRLRPNLAPTMLDLSPALLALQKEALREVDAEYVPGNFFDFPLELLRKYELAIFNENLGDFPTVSDIPSVALHNPENGESSIISDIRHDFEKYAFPIPDLAFVHYNIGAVRAIEKLCTAGIPFIYLSEHSCEASPPDNLAALLDVPADGNPRAIRLCGHTEYTVKFSHLEAVARFYGYETHRGSFADFLPLNWNDELNFIITSRSAKPEHELIRQFVEDIYTYEYLVLKTREV